MKRRGPVVLLPLAACTLTTSASGLEPLHVAGEPVRIEITEAASLLVNGDNRDSRPNQVSSLANDDWTMFYNRLNLQASSGRWQLSLRIDSAWFPASPDPTAIGLELVETRPRPLPPGAEEDPAYFRAKVKEAGTELSNRYIDWTYPAKYSLGYITPELEVTVGDVYAQLGRGLVLSVRKYDELSSDTTVRGGRVTARFGGGPGRLKVTALGGTMNPLRIDEASGRYLSVDDGVASGVAALTEAGMPRPAAGDDRAIELGYLAPATPTYAPDRLAAAQLEGTARGLKLGTQASLLDRQPALSPDLVRSSHRIVTASQSLELADLARHGNVYAEAAVQRLAVTGADDVTGHALYGSATLIADPVSVVAEAKHYRSFFPLLANVDVSRAREFSIVQYSAPPTTEAFWVDTEFEGFNTCVSGGRARANLQLKRQVSVFAWAGRYHTWAELAPNPTCETRDELLNRVWDLAVGTELGFQNRRSRAALTVGARSDDSAEPFATSFGPSTVYYRENYARYDVIAWLGGPFSLQLQGWHRRRYQALGRADDPWFEGFHLTGLEWSPHLSLAFGAEYDTNPQTPDTYFNAQVVVRPTTATSIALFAGQRRGTLRCVGGVCRVFPAFEGARLDLTARF